MCAMMNAQVVNDSAEATEKQRITVGKNLCLFGWGILLKRPMLFGDDHPLASNAKGPIVSDEGS